MIRERSSLWIPGVAGVLLVLWQLQPIQGQIGHDYYLAFTEYLIGLNNFLRNGLAVPHFTASLCAGIPFFADPQSTYYSLPQFLVFFFPPFTASVLTYAVFYLAGYVGMRRLSWGVFHFGYLSSHLCALLFALNGFGFAHLFAGHVTHHIFLLTPWVYLFLLQPGSTRRTQWKNGMRFSLLVAYGVYSGGMHVLLLWLVSTFFFLPIWWGFSSKRRPVDFLLSASLFTGLLVSAKLVLGYFFLQNAYPMPVHASSENPFFIAFRYFFFLPSATPLQIPFGELHFGPWEYVGFVSKAAFPAMLFFFYDAFRALPQRRGLLAATYLVGSILFVLIAAGSWKPQVLAHYHNPIKLFGVFVLPLLLMFGYAANRGEHFLRRRFPAKTATLAFAFLSVCFLWEGFHYTNFFVSHRAGINFSNANATAVWTHLSRTQLLPPVLKVNATRGTDLVGLASGSTSLRCAEPTYGYFQEGMKTTVVPGPINTSASGGMNLHHPGCLLFPRYYDCKPWDLIKSTDIKPATKFVQGDTNPWGTPSWLSWLLGIHGVTLVGLLVYLAIPGAMRIGEFFKKT